MKKKIFLLVSLLFLLCGCTAEVNLEIKSDKVKETVIINTTPEGDYTMDRLPDAFRKYVPAYAKDVLADAEPDTKKSGISYYDREQEQVGNGYKFTYNYNFKLDNYKEARSIKNGFKSSNIYVDKKAKTVLLSTDNSGLLYFQEYPFLTDVTVNIKSDYKVIESNADYVNDNIYSWELSRNNNNKNIYMLLDKSSKYDEGVIIDLDEDLGEDEYNENEETNNNDNSDNNSDKNSSDNSSDKKDKDRKDEISESSKLVENMNENPFIYIILGIVLFIIIIFVFTKFAKIKKVK